MDEQSNYWERVFTVDFYFDGPRRGIANFRGDPHVFDCEFDAASDDWSETFSLSRISAEQLELAVEHWAILVRWMAARDADLLKHFPDPPLAVDRARFEELQPFVAQALAVDQSQNIRAIAEFRGSLPDALQVRWRRR